MKPTDAFTIQAFTAVLPKLDVVLPQELKQAIHTAGKELAKHNFSGAAATMRDLASRDRAIDTAYTPVYRKFQTRYTDTLLGLPIRPLALPEDPVELASQSESSASPSDRGETTDRSAAPSVDAAASDAQSQVRESRSAQLSSLFPEVLLERMTVPILTANDFVYSARALIQQVKTQQEQLPESMHLFVITLQRAVATFDEQTHQVLRLLEHQLLTLEDITYALNMRPEQAGRIVQMLLKEGYIDSARSNPLGRAMAVFLPAPRAHPTITSETQFVLTSKGFFQLNPLLSGRHSEDELE
ncbi:MAG: hypothetical protein WBA57_11655 [Elainellaceae cyanobacterium]